MDGTETIYRKVAEAVQVFEVAVLRDYIKVLENVEHRANNLSLKTNNLFDLSVLN